MYFHKVWKFVCANEHRHGTVDKHIKYVAVCEGVLIVEALCVCVSSAWYLEDFYVCPH